MERVAIFGIMDLELDAVGGGTVTLSTDLPGTAIAIRETKSIPITTTRRVVRFRLQGTTKGRLYSIKVIPAGGFVVRLYSGRIWARVLPGAEWAWYAIPIPPTSSEWTAVPLPIPETGQWTSQALPIPPTGEFAPSKLDIPPTSDWTPSPLPIAPTPPNPSWVNIPVDE